MKDLLVKLQIQFFAEDGQDESNNDSADQNDEENEDLTFDEILSVKEYKSEFDRRVNAAVETYKKNQAKKKPVKKEQPTVDTGQQESTVETENPFESKYVQAEIKWALAQNGVSPEKANRAVRLIDSEGLLDEDGELSAEQLNSAITELLKEWPELKGDTKEKEEDKTSIKFKIGGDNTKDKGKADDLIAKAFGNE
jgi:hypothetical protein